MTSGIDDIFTGFTSLFNDEDIDWKAWGMQKIVQAATLGLRLGVQKLGKVISGYAATKNNKFVKGAFIHMQNKLANLGAQKVGLINKDAKKDFEEKMENGKKILTNVAQDLNVTLEITLFR